MVHLLSILSFLNTAYTFYRKRNYRLFETPLDVSPNTPSAHRVRVEPPPLSSSPFRYLSSKLTVNAAEARSYSDATRDVWELSVWDPTPLCLRVSCLFGPGHVIIYWLFLPTALQDPRPSTTIITTMALAAVLSFQLLALQYNFSQQSKDNSVIHKEVLNEYDIKFVHPRTQPQMRDVGTQVSAPMNTSTQWNDEFNAVDTYTPTVVINRGYHTRPNPNYVKHVDPEYKTPRSTPSLKVSQDNMSVYAGPAYPSDVSTPTQSRTVVRQPHFRTSMGPRGINGGNLSVYSHANSPLKKSASTHFSDGHDERERSMSPMKRGGSPLKRSSVPGNLNGVAANQRRPYLQETAAE